MHRTWRVLALSLAVLVAVSLTAGEAGATRFGRNKVQYGSFTWTIVRTEHFDVYYYEGSEDLADAACKIVEQANAEFERVLGHELSTVIPVIIYASHNDFRQTNVSSSHIGEGVGGFTELFKNRVVVPFTGSYEDLRHVLYHELTHVFMFDIVYGGLVESVIRQAYMNPVPLWFVEGLAEYVSQGWDTEAEMILRDLTLADMLVPIQYLGGGYLVYKEGQSVLCYIASTYGPEKIEEMVKTVAKTHSLERALMDATGLTTAELSKEWAKSLKKRYWPEVTSRERAPDAMKLLTDHNRESSYMNIGPAASPDGQKVAFLTDRSGYTDIFVASALDGTILSKPVRGNRSDEFELLHVLRPGASWSPDGSELCFVAKAGASDALHIVDGQSGRKRASLRFPLDGMFTPAWSPDGKKIVFVGTSKGASDLYVTDVDGENLRRLTRDFYDERNPQWSPDGRSIAFASDRNSPDMEDLRRSYDIFVMELEALDVQPVVATRAEEGHPTWSPDGRTLAFVSDLSGSPQLHFADLEAGTSVRATNLAGGVTGPSWARDADRLAMSVYGEGGYDIASVKDPLAVFEEAGTLSEPRASVDEGYLRGEEVGSEDGDAYAELVCPARAEVAPDTTAAPGEGTAAEGAEADDADVAEAGMVAGEAGDGAESGAAAVETSEFAESGAAAVETDEVTEAGTATEDVDEPTEADAVADAGGDTAEGAEPSDADGEEAPGSPGVGVADGETGDGHGEGPFGRDADESETLTKAKAAYRAAVGAEAHRGGGRASTVEDDERVPGTVERYRPRFSPDWVSGGFAYTSGYGFSGAAEIAISDVLGNHRFYIATNFFSSLESSNFQVLYQHLANRVNYALGVYNFKDYYYSDRTWLGEDLGEKRYFTERSYGVSAGLSYPFSMFSRVELDVSALSVDRVFAEETDEGTIQLTDEEVSRSLIIPSVRFVNDTTLWGSTGPIGGGRSSLVVSRAWESGGDFEYLTGIADVRKYMRMGARHSLALKLVGARSTARNAQNFYMGGVNSLRGYDDFEFHGRNLALASLEFRYPFIDHLQIASPIPLSLWGLRGVMFLDLGAAWDDDFRGVVGGAGGRRLNDIKASHGFGARMNLSIFVVRVDWAWPTDFRSTGDMMTHFALGAEF